MTTNFDPPTDPSPASIYDEREPEFDPAEYFAQKMAERFERIEKRLAEQDAEMSRLRRLVRQLSGDLSAQHDMNGWEAPTL